MEHKRLMLLSRVKAGTTVRLVGINAGRGLKQHLAAMGLLPNAEIRVIRNLHYGRLIVNVKNTKVVLGRGMAHKITVR